MHVSHIKSSHGKVNVTFIPEQLKFICKSFKVKGNTYEYIPNAYYVTEDFDDAVAAAIELLDLIQTH